MNHNFEHVVYFDLYLDLREITSNVDLALAEYSKYEQIQNSFLTAYLNFTFLITNIL